MSFLILHLHTIVILRMYPIYNPKHEGSKLLHDCHVLPQYPVTLICQITRTQDCKLDTSQVRVIEPIYITSRRVIHGNR